MTKAKDLTGQKFGKLTAIELDEEKSKQMNKRYWICKCECGGTTSVQTSKLINGGTKSCGCLKYEFNDLTGQKFGRLTVIKRVENYIAPNGRTSVMWLCKCDCGNFIKLQTSHLIHKGVVRCGNCNVYTLSEDGTYYSVTVSNSDKKFLIDVDDYELVSAYTWSKRSVDYEDYIVKHDITLHRFLMKPKSGQEVDHINRNQLDNRRRNLRICSDFENAKNKGLSKSNKSGFTGVRKNKNNKYIAYITSDGNEYYLGIFEKLEDAVVARLRAELKYFGKEYAPQRHLFEQYGIK